MTQHPDTVCTHTTGVGSFGQTPRPATANLPAGQHPPPTVPASPSTPLVPVSGARHPEAGDATSIALALSMAPGSDIDSSDAMTQALADQEAALAFFERTKTSRNSLGSPDEIVTPTARAGPTIENTRNTTNTVGNPISPAAVAIPAVEDVDLSTSSGQPPVLAPGCGWCTSDIGHVACPVTCSGSHVFCHQCGPGLVEAQCPCPLCGGSLALAECSSVVESTDVRFLGMRRGSSQVREYNVYPGPSRHGASPTPMQYRATPKRAPARQDPGVEEMRARMLGAAERRIKKNTSTPRDPTKFHRNLKLS
ncbi:hypothetical protein BDN72DRAFT_309124 [Pluteus cervinus]|uniref:Uncharacterized protein n=1 Tax=Pluteus cervinus TaxID=181527 RepID=A0ACD3ACZ5_9AGAR|nr:hypothetical protein BDN72DRAFT_309124 [Pluteus cervinus]